ncbi:MAG: ankyrin repeat domain-containing protein [Rhodothermales bacterium]
MEGLRLAAEAQIIATEWDIITSRFSAGMDLAKSFISLAGAIGDIMRLKGAQGLRDRAQLSMQGALLAQHQLFQGDYYLRPFYVKGHGRGVTVVETGTGLRRDLIFSPHNTPSLAYGLDIPTFAVSPAGDRLVMFGISLRTERYERRGKWKTHVPNYSILSYDLGALVFVHHATVFTSVIDAIIGDESELVAWLLDRGGDVNERYPGSGETPLMYAAGSKPHMVSLLLQRGADVNAVSESGKTALDITPFRDVYDLLVASGGRSGSGEVPPPPSLDPPQLLLAITLNLPDRVRALVEGGEDVNLRNSQNETPLFYAAATDQLALVQLLLDFGADVNAVSDLGQTALDLAHSDPVRKTLRSAGGRLGSEVH